MPWFDHRLTRFLFPQIALKDLMAVAGTAILGALVAGLYGIVHDQITFSISPEYFTKLKFNQFRFADIELHERLFVAQIGFLATWWVGLIAAWCLARQCIPDPQGKAVWRKLLLRFLMMTTVAALFGMLGFGFAVWRESAIGLASWQPVLEHLKIDQPSPFVRVAYIHNFSYAGALAGFVLALIAGAKSQPAA